MKEVIVEQFIPFDSEITLLTVTQQNGPTLFCQPIGHVQKGGDYRESFQPAAISPEMLKDAQDMAEKITRALTGAGIWGVEFFLSHKDGVIFSRVESSSARYGNGDFGRHTKSFGIRIALPCRFRFADTGNYTRTNGSQCGHPVGSGKPRSTEVFRRGGGLCGNEHLSAYFREARSHIGRRMGVVVCWDKLDADQEALRNKCKALASKVKVY